MIDMKSLSVADLNVIFNPKMLNKLKQILYFTYVWLLTGFVLASFVLTGPFRRIVVYLRLSGFSVSQEKIIVNILMFFFILISLWVAKIIFHWLKHTANIAGVTLFNLFVGGLFIFSLWFWLTPSAPIKGNIIYSADGHFAVGPYPSTKQDILNLQNSGYAGIVSLLSNKVVPFEPVLIAREKKICKKFGMPFIHIPMLPWIKTEATTIAKIQHLVQHAGNKKYYVHCYLGQDRVLKFLRIVDTMTGENSFLKKTKIMTINRKRLSRGPVYLLDQKVVVIPFPTREEFLQIVTNHKKNVVNAPFKTIISFNTEDRKNSRNLVGRERALVKPYGIHVFYFPVESRPLQTKRLYNITRRIKKMTGPILVYDYWTIPKSPVMDGFIRTYLANTIALPPSLFNAKKIKFIAPNMLLGQTLDNKEIQQLKNKGITAIAYVSDHDNLDLKQKTVAKQLKWVHIKPSMQQTQQLTSDEAWYVFGPQLNNIKAMLIAQHKQQLTQLNKRVRNIIKSPSP